MPPKRKNDAGDTTTKQKPNGVQTDNEIFMQAFEKPTQIYRYLRTRNMILPIFLNRNLTYMKSLMSRTHKKRKDFKIDSILGTVEAKERKINGLALPNKYLSLLFTGFYIKEIEEMQQNPGHVKVEVILVKNAHNKRKETSAAVQTTIGSVVVAVNPSEIGVDRSKIPAISIPVEQFDTNSPSPATHTLIFKIEHCPEAFLTNGMDDVKKMKMGYKAYSVELFVTDKVRCLLEDGEYDLTVQDVTNLNYKFSPKKLTGLVWETFEYGFIEGEDFKYDEVFNKEPTLKFHLQWTKEGVAGLVERPLPITACSQDANKENQPNGCDANFKNNNNGMEISKTETEDADKKVRIFYHFVYNNNSRQQTEDIRSDYRCPWCCLNCINLYALLKHLKLCHPRFAFTYVPIPDGTRIDVAVDDTYDASYTGSPHDLLTSGGFSRNAGPIRRSSVTNILVCRPRRPKPSLSEFLEMDENEFESQRPYISGHNRLYHHTMTCLPVLPKELDIDSEGESDPNWLKHKTTQMIDEFTDVNEGEKEIMKLWNLHIMKYGFVGDCQIALACEMFVDEHGKDLLERNLYRNFILHLSSLFDFGLISPENMYTAVQKIQRILNEQEEARTQMTKRNEEQAEYWKTTGIIKHQQKLAEEQKKKEKEQAEKKELEDKKLIVTATDFVRAITSTPSSTKNVTATVKTTTTVTPVAPATPNSKSNVSRVIRRRSAGAIQRTTSRAKVTDIHKKFLNSRRRSACRQHSSAKESTDLTDLLPKNAFPKIVLTRKSLTNTNVGNGASIKTRKSAGK
ncbi:polycomb protein suz12-A isoform X2 [Culicoides brevitarsis]|uniref:polycomb protein suz12-A isoform X2 n=1 Tax=Culicoides brevitarsis TaxID=469753 RepID=UPI00307C0570